MSCTPLDLSPASHSPPPVPYSRHPSQPAVHIFAPYSPLTHYRSSRATGLARHLLLVLCSLVTRHLSSPNAMSRPPPVFVLHFSAATHSSSPVTCHPPATRPPLARHSPATRPLPTLGRICLCPPVAPPLTTCLPTHPRNSSVAFALAIGSYATRTKTMTSLARPAPICTPTTRLTATLQSTSTCPTGHMA